MWKTCGNRSWTNLPFQHNIVPQSIEHPSALGGILINLIDIWECSRSFFVVVVVIEMTEGNGSGSLNGSINIPPGRKLKVQIETEMFYWNSQRSKFKGCCWWCDNDGMRALSEIDSCVYKSDERNVMLSVVKSVSKGSKQDLSVTIPLQHIVVGRIVNLWDLFSLSLMDFLLGQDENREKKFAQLSI